MYTKMTFSNELSFAKNFALWRTSVGKRRWRQPDARHEIFSVRPTNFNVVMAYTTGLWYDGSYDCRWKG